MQINIFIRLVFVVVSLFAIGCGLARATEEAKHPRVALVIGNSHYEDAVGPLRNTGNDAKVMAKALRFLGFTVIEKHNVTRDELMTALMQFRGKLRGAEVGVFYFAGHGISVGGANYLLPVKSSYSPGNASGTDLRLLAETKLFNAEQAVAEMNDSGVGCNLVILDACRSTPADRNPQSRDAATAGGLVEMSPPAGSLVAFATDAGHTAADGDGANGLYTEELIKHLLTPGLSIEQVFKRTRAGVMQRSGGRQVPAEYSRLIGEDIYLAGLSAAKPSTPTEEPIRKAQAVPVPALAEMNKLAADGEVTGCLQLLHRYVKSRGPGNRADVPLATLLAQVKGWLRDPKTAESNATLALQSCDLILPSISDCLVAGSPERADLAAKAYNRRGDALLLLKRAEEALGSYNSAAELDPDDGYIIYNRGRAFLALNRSDEARADFALAAGARFKHSGVRKPAQQALAGMK